MERRDYPDISTLLAAKHKRRQMLAALTWEQKVAIVERMRSANPRGMWKPSPTNNGPSSTEETAPR